jgi:hypothetical protein
VGFGGVKQAFGGQEKGAYRPELSVFVFFFVFRFFFFAFFVFRFFFTFDFFDFDGVGCQSLRGGSGSLGLSHEDQGCQQRDR